MIVGRPNAASEVAQQEYMAQKIQPVISKIVLSLLETKPENPIPPLYAELDIMAKEAREEETGKQAAAGNHPLTEEEFEEYLELKKQRTALQNEVDLMLSKTHWANKWLNN